MTLWLINRVSHAFLHAHKHCEQLVGDFAWLPFWFLFLIILVGVGNSVTFNNVVKNGNGVLLSYTHALSFLAQVLPMGSPREGISVQWRKGLFHGAWCCFGWIIKDNSAFTVQYLPSSLFPLASFCSASPYCSFQAEGLSVQPSVLVGSFSSSKDYANSNWINELLSTLSDAGKDIPC